MIQGRRSGTAERVAMRRAAHQLYDRPLIFEDPVALAILSEEALEQVHKASADENTHPWAVGLRSFLAVRSRFAEEELANAVAQGVRQYVVLGAGLDTFAWRNPFPDLAVFEVDHPDTQAWKQERLERAGLPVPDALRFAPVNFECDTLAHGLAAAGFAREQPTFFSWLGVVPYLTREAAFTTLGFIAGAPAGSSVVFDYSIPPASMSEMERRVFDYLAERVARAGEPFRLFFEPEQLEAELRQMGFREVSDSPGSAIRARWLHDGEQQRFHSRSGRLLWARV